MKRVTPDPLNETPIVRDNLLLDPVLFMKSCGIIMEYYPSPNQSGHQVQSNYGSDIHQQTFNCVFNSFIPLLLLHPLLPLCAEIALSLLVQSKLQIKAGFRTQNATQGKNANLHSFSAVQVVPSSNTA